MDEHKDATIQVIAEKINSLHADVGELRGNMKEMAGALIKLTQIEVNQMYTNQNYERLNANLEKSSLKYETLEKRVDDLEKEQPMTKQVTGWVMKAAWGIMAASAAYVAKLLGVF